MAESRASRRWPRGVTAVACVVIVGGVVLATHWPVLWARAETFDDAQYFFDNPVVQNPSWGAAARFLREVLQPSTVSGYYQPLTMISLMLDCAAGGGPDNLRPVHRTNLILHVLNVVLVMLFLSLVFGRPGLAALAGLLFGLHPMTVEPIAWVGERKTMLSTFFALGCLVLYVLYTRKGSWKPYAASLGLFVLALLSKPTSTPLPVLMLLLDAWPLRRLSWRSVREKVPFLVSAALCVIITIVSQARSGEVRSPQMYGLLAVPLTLCHSVVFYLHKIVWPVNLTPYYPPPEPLALSQPAVLAGVTGTVVLIAALLISLRWTRALLAGWLFFFVAILPTTGTIGFAIVLTSDKYAYLPALGFLMILTAGLAGVWDRLGRTRRAAVGRGGLVAIGLALAAGEVGVARDQLGHWQDTETLCRHMLAIAPQAGVLHSGLARELTRQGHVEEAAQQYGEALRMNPRAPLAHLNLGILLAQQGRAEEAVEHYRVALDSSLYAAKAHYRLAYELATLGRSAEAMEHYRETLCLKPHDYRAHERLAVELARGGREGQAIQHYQLALEENPRVYWVHNSLARLLAGRGDVDEAIAHYQQALRLRPSDPDEPREPAAVSPRTAATGEAAPGSGQTIPVARGFAMTCESIGHALIEQGRLDEAVPYFESALRFDADLPDAHNNLGNLLARRHEPERAAEHFAAALRLAPKLVEAHTNLGACLYQAGKVEEAEAQLREAIRLRPDFVGAYLNLGVVLRSQGRTAEVIGVYEAGLRAVPDDPRLSAALGEARAQHVTPASP